jgi:hypothetical protein
VMSQRRVCMALVMCVGGSMCDTGGVYVTSGMCHRRVCRRRVCRRWCVCCMYVVSVVVVGPDLQLLIW